RSRRTTTKVPSRPPVLSVASFMGKSFAGTNGKEEGRRGPQGAYAVLRLSEGATDATDAAGVGLCQWKTRGRGSGPPALARSVRAELVAHILVETFADARDEHLPHRLHLLAHPGVLSLGDVVDDQ